MYKLLSLLLLVSLMLSACGAKSTPAAAPAPSTSPTTEAQGHVEEEEEEHESNPVDLGTATAGPYTLQVDQMGAATQGHFNFHVTAGGDVGAIRGWIGDEAATDVMVSKLNWEENHYCAHLEVGESVRAGAKLWFEVESPGGKSHKSSLPLKL